MPRAGWCCVRELRDGIGDQAPDRRALAIAFDSESSARLALSLCAFCHSV
jgi:hypothetical protein